MGYIWDFNAPSGKKLKSLQQFEEEKQQQPVRPSFSQEWLDSVTLPQATSPQEALRIAVEQANQPQRSVPAQIWRAVDINVDNLFKGASGGFLGKGGGLEQLISKATGGRFQPFTPTAPETASEMILAGGSQLAGGIAGAKGIGNAVAPVTNTQRLISQTGQAAKDAGVIAPAIKRAVETYRKLPTPAKVGVGAAGTYGTAQMISGATNPNIDDPGLLQQTGAALRAGTGDVLETFGGALKWKGADSAGQGLMNAGAKLKQGYEGNRKEFSWKSFFDPEFYANNVARSVPFTLSLLPAMFAGYKLGGAGGAKLALSPFKKAVLASITGAVVSRPLESALEAGGVYNEALARGVDEEKANKAADSAFKKNLKLVGLDAAQLIAAFAPAPLKAATKAGKVAMGTGRVAAGALVEAGEEGAQEVFQRQAMGTDTRGVGAQILNADPAMKEAMAIGGLFGAGMGGAGAVMDAIRTRTVEVLPPETQLMLQGNVQKYIAAGATQDEALEIALDEIAQTPEGQEIIAQVANAVADEVEAAQGALPGNNINTPLLNAQKLLPAGTDIADNKRQLPYMNDEAFDIYYKAIKKDNPSLTKEDTVFDYEMFLSENPRYEKDYKKWFDTRPTTPDEKKESAPTIEEMTQKTLEAAQTEGITDPNKIGLGFVAKVTRTQKNAPEVVKRVREALRQKTPVEATQVTESTAKGTESVGIPIEISLDDIPHKLAYDAHRGTSFVPEDRAKQEQQGYVAHIKDVYEKLKPLAKTEEQKALLKDELQRYRDKYLELEKGVLAAKSRVMSTMITGRGNFPVRKNEKAVDAEAKRVREMLDWQEKAFKTIKKKLSPETEKGSISSDDPDAIEKLQKKVAEAEQMQDKMKKANAIIRKKNLSDEEKIAQMMALGLKEDTAKQALEPDYMGRKGFPDYALQNNNANIKRMKERIEYLQKQRAQESKEVEVNGTRIVDNVEDNRVQIFFKDKPSEEMRAVLRKNAFKWAPSIEAWQRQRSGRALEIARDIMGKGSADNEVAATTTKQDALSTIQKEMNQKVDNTIGDVTPPMGFAIKVINKPSGKSKQDGYSFADKDIEERFNAANGIPDESLRSKISTLWNELWRKATREYEHLPRNAEFARLRADLLALSKQKGVRGDETLRLQQAITINLDKYQFDVFRRHVILADLMEEMEAGHALPFGFTEETLDNEWERINKEIKKYPEIQRAIDDRKKIWDATIADYTKGMRDIGFNVDNKFTRANYYRHQVLEYAQEKGRAVTGTGQKLKTPAGRGFLKKRGGSELDINTNYLQAEYEVMAQMLYDIEVAKTIKSVDDNYNIIEQLRTEAKRVNKENPDAEKVTWQELIPDGYVEWQPREGNVFFMTDTIPGRLAEQLLTDQLEELGISKKDLSQALAIGGRRKSFVVKQEVALTLDNLTKITEESLRSKLVSKPLQAWKVWQLLSPQRWFKYNARNMSGDAEAVFVGNPTGFAKMPRAAKELYEVFAGNKSMPSDMKDWFERGGMETLLQAQELGEVNKLKMFMHLQDKKGSVTELPIKAWQGYWKAVRLSTDYREALLRYANYLSYLEQIQGNMGKPKNFGASIPEEVVALKDPRDMAFKLSNELLGAYDEVSVIGQDLAKYLLPFWRWNEVNFRRSINLIKNAARDEKLASAIGKKVVGTAALRMPFVALKIGKLVIMGLAMWSILSLWNNKFFPEEEKELPNNVKARPHIIFGRDEDGKIIYFDRLGFVQDFLGWFGLDDGSRIYKDFLSGRRTLKQIATDMVKSPANKLIGAVGPTFKWPAEALAKKSYFPDAFKPRLIRDRWEYLAQGLGLGDEYKMLAGKPVQTFGGTRAEGYWRSWRDAMVYTADPGQSAYYDILDEKRRYLDKIGKGSEGGFTSPKSEALYNFKLSVRYKDKVAAKKYLTEYVMLGGTEKGLEQSMKSMHPLNGLVKNKEKDEITPFVESLSYDDKVKLARAIKYYNEVMLGKK